jgi:hypothetical protein
MISTTPLSDTELTQFCALIAKNRRFQSLSLVEDVEFVKLLKRIRLVPPTPPILPPTIVIPKTYSEDFICRDPAVDNS